MNLLDLYKSLALGELKNLAMVQDGTIIDEERSTIILHANEGLKRLYTRFLMAEDTLFLEQRGFLTSYNLTSKYAQSNYVSGAGHSFYINDLGKPFKDDLLRVMTVWDEYGQPLPLNDQTKFTSVFTPHPTLLQVPHPKDGAPLQIQYQAGHEKLVEDDPEQEITLPQFLTGALNAFIASKVFSHMNTQENTIKAAEHRKAFDTICIEVVEQDLITTGASNSGVRFENNGWV